MRSAVCALIIPLKLVFDWGWKQVPVFHMSKGKEKNKLKRKKKHFGFPLNVF